MLPSLGSSGLPQARLDMGTHSALYYGDLATAVTDMAVMAPEPEAQVTRAPPGKVSPDGAHPDPPAPSVARTT
jgi:hypothetical protein